MATLTAEKCGMCGGSGKYGFSQCAWCHGSGVTADRQSQDTTSFAAEKCGMCGGSGKSGFSQCAWCHGSGVTADRQSRDTASSTAEQRVSGITADRHSQETTSFAAEKCGMCGGSGKSGFSQCAWCHGSGVKVSSSSILESDREHQTSRKQRQLQRAIGKERVIDMFRAFDQDGDSYVSADELADVLSQVGVEESKVRSILHDMDVDGDARVTMAEFTEWLFRDTRDRQLALTASDTANEGWGLHRLEDPQSETFRNIRKLFRVLDPHNLGIGRNVGSWAGKYSDIEVVCAWKIHKPYAKAVYDAKKSMYRKDNKKTRNALGNEGPDYPFPTKLDGPGRDLFKLDDSVNEKALLHGTKAETVLALLRNGLDERYSGGLFGKGAYLAEDPSKIDQYCTESSTGPDDEQLNQFLYDDFERPMPDTPLFYCFVVRALLGAYIRTRDGETSCDVEGQSIWATSDRRQLTQIPNVVPTTPYQSLVAETGGKVARHREFIVFNGDCCKLEYLIAYRRV